MKKIELDTLGTFIKQMREKKGITQAEFAKAMGTTQSVVARIESGTQNLTTETLNKISEVFNQSIVSLAPKSIDFEVTGGKELSGSIVTNGSKNAVMGILCAALLNKGKTTINKVPQIEEVNRILEVMNSIGIKSQYSNDKTSLTLTMPKVLDLDSINHDSATKTRTILMFMGALIHDFEVFRLPLSKGCNLGKRTIGPHLKGLEKFGVKVEFEENNYKITSHLAKMTTYPDVEIIMSEASDTGAELLIIAAAKYPGKTIIKYAPSNYMVQDVCLVARQFGARVEGIGTHIITIHGVKEIKMNAIINNSQDPIEAMMFISAAICTNSSITVCQAPIDFLELEISKLEEMGVTFTKSAVYLSENNHTKLVDLTIHKHDHRLMALDEKISCGAYPDINIDNLPFFVPICALAEGRSLIHDWVYENRAIYFTELNRLGASVALADPHRAFIQGVNKLNAAQVVCPPALRPAMIILIAMLAADGVSTLRNVYSIKRGYEDVANRLNHLGADIKVI
jgi:UDP-N-acetylglucosamine 1-carboxyvinyltransferase